MGNCVSCTAVAPRAPITGEAVLAVCVAIGRGLRPVVTRRMGAHRSVPEQPAISGSLMPCLPPILHVRPQQDETPDHFVVLTPQPGFTPLALNTAAASGVFR
jgi:hypothetical protein